MMPRVSRDGGSDGLHFYRIIIANSQDHMNERGVLALMIAYEQLADNIENLVIQNAAFDRTAIEFVKDTKDKKRSLFVPKTHVAEKQQ